MITAIRIVTTAGTTLFVHARTRSGMFATGDGSVSLLQLLAGLRQEGLKARVDTDGGVSVDIFDADGAIRPEAAGMLVTDFQPPAVAQATLLAEIARAAEFCDGAPDVPETVDATS